MAGIDQPPRNGQFGKESDWECSEILGDPDDMDAALAALVEKSERISDVNSQINDMLIRHGVNTIYQLGLSDEESSKREDAALEGYRQDVENGDFSKLDISALEEYGGDKLALAEAIDLQLQVYIEKRIASEMFVMMCVSTELDSQRVMDGTEKTDMIADHLLVLDETSRSPWFGFLNEALGGEDVSSGQVEKEMNAQAAANKTGDQDAKFLKLLDGIFMETGGGLSDDQMLSVAGSVTSLATIEEMGGQDHKERLLYSNYMAELKSIGLSDQQITELIAAHKEIMQKPNNAEE